MPVIFDVVGGVAVEGLQVAADAGDPYAAGTTIGVPQKREGVNIAQ